MVGDPSGQKLKTKGAETWGLLCFLLDELPHHLWKLGPEGGRLLGIPTALRDMALIFDTSGIQMSDAAVDACWRHYRTFLDLTGKYDEL
eukprot:5520699-Pyramimonas_sp.AAC.1